MPKGRRAEAGPIDNRYMLTETSSSRYTERTRKNIDCCDGTLIINLGELTGGTAATAEYAERAQKPILIIQLDDLLVREEDLRA
jgi:Circularly permutated YpsA SLOG family